MNDALTGNTLNIKSGAVVSRREGTALAGCLAVSVAVCVAQIIGNRVLIFCRSCRVPCFCCMGLYARHGVPYLAVFPAVESAAAPVSRKHIILYYRCSCDLPYMPAEKKTVHEPLSDHHRLVGPAYYARRQNAERASHIKRIYILYCRAVAFPVRGARVRTPPVV